MAENTGKKNDQGKPAMNLVPPHAVLQIAKVMGYGAQKYGAHNYLGGMDWGRLVGAAERHIQAFKSGIDIDPESNIAHLAHAAASIMMLLELQELGLGTDDRWHNQADGTYEQQPLTKPEHSRLAKTVVSNEVGYTMEQLLQEERDSERRCQLYSEIAIAIQAEDPYTHETLETIERQLQERYHHQPLVALENLLKEFYYVTEVS